ncbi:MAG: exodeoxyribonuclease VII small subunit [Bacteroidia bacterium]|jgi:exodeoxyribonuclease VII small subunit|nr:exodeoxyribonuclease VII small subunit [Bacteroidia bacterium]
MSESLTYSAALSELNEIARAIDNESIPLDELSAKVKRASELIAFCKKRLHATEEEVKKILGDMEETAQ